jgi:hypothetical protein
LRPANVIRAAGAEVVSGKPYPGASDTPTSSAVEPMDVLVVPITPTLDPVLGLYCDVEIGVPEGKADAFLTSYMPFIQLGLARYPPVGWLPQPSEMQLEIVPIHCTPSA